VDSVESLEFGVDCGVSVTASRVGWGLGKESVELAQDYSSICLNLK
jgi:hypothetical protein